MYRLLIVLFLTAGACSPVPGSKGGNTTELNNGNPNNGNTNNGSDAGNNGGADMADGGEMLPDLVMEPGGPEFVNLSVSPQTLTEGENATVLVQVTDPDGFDDIGGGRLLDGDANVISNFRGSGGTYEIELTWDEINGLEPISFDTMEPRIFLVEFFDGAGLISQESFTITLSCNGAPACLGTCGEAFCDNACVTEFVTDDNCGQCGNVCDPDERCENEQCETRPPTNYFRYCEDDLDCSSNTGTATCTDIPDSVDKRCVAFCDEDIPDACGPNALCVTTPVISGLFFCVTTCPNNTCLDDLVCVERDNESGCSPAGFE